MATLYTEQSKNISKTWLLMAVFLAFVCFIGYFLSQYYGNPVILYIAVILSLVTNFAGYWYSDKIALSMAGAVPVDPNHSSNPARDLELLRTVENIAITAGLPKPRTYIIQDPAPNAFATGRNAAHGAIAVTSGLLNMMDQSELEGVIAHEMSHIGNKDTQLSTIVVILVGLLSIASDIFIRSNLFGGRGRDREEGGNALAIVGIILMILSPIIGTLIQLAISRRREYLADATGALLTRYPEGLANALRKIEAYSKQGGAPLTHASNATAHLYISNPFGIQAFKGLHKLFLTHPPTADRIRALLGQRDSMHNH